MPPTGSAREPWLRNSLRVLGRRKRLIAGVALLILAADLVYSLLSTPVYVATSELLVGGAKPVSTAANPEDDRARAVRTELMIINSRPVTDAVQRVLGYRPKVSADQVGDSDVIRLRAEGSHADRAVTEADVYASTYAELRTKQLAADLATGKRGLQAKISDLDGRIAALPAGPERDGLTNERAQLEEGLDQLEVDSALASSYVRVLSRARPPGSPARPKVVRDAAIALGIGLLVGTLVAIVAESLDDSVKTRGRLERALRDVPVMAVVPPGDRHASGRQQLVTLQEPGSASAEAYRTLRAALQRVARGQPMQTVQITSPGPMQGTATTAANLGVVLAQAGLRVAVVGCDLRQPRLHQLFELPNLPGFTSVLEGTVPLSVALRPVEEEPGLSVLPSGPLPPDPSDVLASRRTLEVLTSLQAEFDVVLLDTPPVLPFTDAVILSRRVDATLLACVAKVTSRSDATRAAEALRQVDAPLIGAVLQGAAADRVPADAQSDTPEVAAKGGPAE